MSDTANRDEEVVSTEKIQAPKEKEDDESPAVETISVSEEDEKVLPADYIIVCRGDLGQVVRYKTHKQALFHGSRFFKNMFTTCGAKEKNASGRENALEELEMEESASVLLVLLRSMYSEGATIEEKMDQYYFDLSDEDYSR